MMKLQTLAAMAVGVLTATLGGFEAHAQTAAPVEARNVVLIRGAIRVKGRGAQASVGSAVSSTDASYCAQRWAYYDPASGKYLGDDGQWHPCR
jgi:BA14K-like protein